MNTRVLLAACSIFLVLGCRTQPNISERAKFVPYTGDQQNWKTSPGSFAESVGGFTIYQGPPSKPYNLLGKLVGIDLSNAEVASCGSLKGADAAIIMSDKSVSVGSTTTLVGSFAYTKPNVHNVSTYWLIKFKTLSATQQAEVDQIDKAIANLESHPDGLTLTNEDGTTSFLPPEVEATGIRFLKAKRAEAINSDD